MSRCFPFPPQGYERARNEDANSLLKKQKEKKHRKEKDKERREGKEKKDKERSKDRNKEKKDRKERHKDKDKDKNKASDEKTDEGRNKIGHVYTGECSHGTEQPSDEKTNEGRNKSGHGYTGECSYGTEQLKDSNFVAELSRRIRDEGAVNRSQVAQNFISNRRKNEGIANQNQAAQRINDGFVNGNQVAQKSNIRNEEFENGKQVENGKIQYSSIPSQRINEGFGNDNQVAHNSIACSQNRIKGVGNGNQITKNSVVSNQRRYVGIGNDNQVAHHNFAILNQGKNEGFGHEYPVAQNIISNQKRNEGFRNSNQVAQNTSNLRKNEGFGNGTTVVQNTIFNQRGSEGFKNGNQVVQNPNVNKRKSEIFRNVSTVAQSSIPHKRRNVETGRLMEQAERRNDDKNKEESRYVDKRMVEKRSEVALVRGSSVKTFTDINHIDQDQVYESMPAEKETEKSSEVKDKVSNVKEVDARFQRDRGREHQEKRSNGKFKQIERENKKDQDKLENNIHKNDKEKEKLIGGSMPHLKAISTDIGSTALPKSGGTSTNLEGNLRKRKEIETNGFIQEDEMIPKKFRRLPPLPSSDNGRMLKPCNVVLPSTANQPESNIIRKVGTNNEHEVNGVIKAAPSSVLPRPSVSILASENGEASTRLPHPDFKYLNQILTIPKVEQSEIDFDDQEWLSGSDFLQPKPKAMACDSSQAPQVWAKALEIESPDLYALPYVIPY